MKVKNTKLAVSKIRPNPDNPRTITEEKFDALVRSIKDAPWMLPIRSLVIDEDNVVLGGNMRLKALQEAGIKEVDVVKVEGLTEIQKREFVVKDNLPFGMWDWDTLANEWDSELLNAWGMDIWQESNLEGLFDVEEVDEPLKSFKLTLDYNEADWSEIEAILKAQKGSREEIVMQALRGLQNAGK